MVHLEPVVHAVLRIALAHRLLGRRWYHGMGRLARFGQRQWPPARCGYQERFRSVPVTEADAFVIVTLWPTGPYELVPDALTSLHGAPAALTVWYRSVSAARPKGLLARPGQGT